MNSTSFTKIWIVLKKIFLWVFILHIAWFLYFIIRKFPVNNFAVEHLQTKVLLVCGSLLLIGFVYWKWLRHISSVKKVAVVLREIFFVAYISAVLYILLGFVFNPPITITQIASVLQGNGLHRDYVSYSNMGPNIKLAMIASEDQLFPDHGGFDWKSIEKSLQKNARKRKNWL